MQIIYDATNLFNAANRMFPVAVQIELILRLFIASLCGIAIGYERARRYKLAGPRIHCLICFASALFMVISKYAFEDVILLNGVGQADPARMAAQVLPGISFICLALTYRQGTKLQGLTTAIGIIASCGVGIVIGGGLYLVGIASTAMVLLIQIAMHNLNIDNDSMSTRELTITYTEDPEFRKVLLAELKAMTGDARVHKLVNNDNGTETITLTLYYQKKIPDEELILTLDKHTHIKSVEL